LAKEDLHIYILDSDNVNQSLKCLENAMKKRTRRDKEFWFIDISAFQNIGNASSMLNTLSLDVDDDMFLFMFIESDYAKIWEMYKLAHEKKLIVKDFGSWRREIGLKLTNLEKWQRRRDLSVSIIKHVSGRNIWIIFEAPQQYIRHIIPWKKCSNLMQFLKYLQSRF
jgi:hypothetical protein